MEDRNNRITITICGDGGCGKSSITLRLVRSQWTSDYDPTIEDSYSITRRIDGNTYHLSLTDTAGQEEYRGMWGGSNLSSDAFLMVYDITSLASLHALGYFNDLVDMEGDTRLEAHAQLQATERNRVRRRGGVPGPIMPVKIVAGNKCDLQESREVDAKSGLDWARKRGCGFMETSARNTVNIEETFALIVRRVVEARRRADEEAGLGVPEQHGGARDGLGLGNRLPPRGLSFDGTSQFGLGTRRAVTAPLSPLPVPEEKHMDFGPDQRKGNWWLRRLRCW
jgi:GTPase KRas protein